MGVEERLSQCFHDSMTRNEKLEEAIKLFTEGTLTAFERYNEARHGVLGGGIISS
jgi:uncharacterized protein (DUF1786 family)